ncbi:MAG: sulfur relay protein DsrC [Pseudomonadota bacterium]
MIWLSEILIGDSDVTSFAELTSVLRECAESGERFLGMDIKPPFPDTPENWEDQLEAIFTARL